MKRDWALLSAWGAGVFAAATALLGALLLGGFRFPTAAIVPILLMAVTLVVGPGLLLLSVFLGLALKRRHAKGAGRGATLAFGVLLGAALGMPALLLTPLFFFQEELARVLAEPRSPEALTVFAMGVIGGATSGLTCAWRVTAPKGDPA